MAIKEKEEIWKEGGEKNKGNLGIGEQLELKEQLDLEWCKDENERKDEEEKVGEGRWRWGWGYQEEED